MLREMQYIVHAKNYIMYVFSSNQKKYINYNYFMGQFSQIVSF